MKKRFLVPLLLWSLLCCCAWGCGQRTGGEAGGLFAAPKTPAPSPSPAPALVLLGAGDGGDFSLGAERAAVEAGFRFLSGGGLSTLSAYGGEAGSGALLLYADGTEAGETLLTLPSMPAYAFCTGGAVLPEGMAGTVCAADGSGKLLLDAITAYAPFATPVRALGLLKSADSPGAAGWKEAVAAGKLLSRGTYRQTEREDSAGEWLSRQLAALYPGMVDCVYAETASLALLCEDALTAAGRTDVRVFSDEITGALLARMEDRACLAAAAGIDEEEAGYRAAKNAIALWAGDGSGVQSTLEPSVVFTESRTNP